MQAVGRVEKAVNDRKSDPAERANALKDLGSKINDQNEQHASRVILGALFAEIGRAGDERGITEKDVYAEVLEECVRLIGRLKGKAAWEPLLKIAQNKGQPWRARHYIIRGLTSISEPEITKALVAIVGTHNEKKKKYDLSSDDPRVMAASVEALGNRGDKGALPFLHILVKTPEATWELRLAALEAIKKFNDPESVEPLIDALGVVKDTEGRLKTALIETLQSLTKLPLESPDPLDWKGAITSKEKGVEQKGTGIQPTTTTFFGLKTKSTRIVFVLDKSGSMSEQASEPPEKTEPPKEGEKPVIGTGPDPKIKNPDPLDPKRDLPNDELMALKQAQAIYDKWKAVKPTTRIELLKKEFIKTLYHLDHRVWFTTVWYDSSVQPWSQELVQATWAAKVAAMTHTEKIKPDGMTNMGDALIDNALRMVATGGPKDVGPAAKIDNKRSHIEVIKGPDTVFCMTDGEPNAGKYAPAGLPTNPQDHHNKTKAGILNELQKILPIRKVIIHTICIGDASNTPQGTGVDPSFMKRIADLSGGVTRHITGR
jgi:hypothetical protein